VVNAAVYRSVFHAVVARVLMDNRRDEKGAEELARHVFSDAHADGTAETGHAGAVRGVTVGGDRNTSFTRDGYKAEWVEEVAGG
jgi:hypothetical protein